MYHLDRIDTHLYRDIQVRAHNARTRARTRENGRYIGKTKPPARAGGWWSDYGVAYSVALMTSARRLYLHLAQSPDGETGGGCGVEAHSGPTFDVSRPSSQSEETLYELHI